MDVLALIALGSLSFLAFVACPYAILTSYTRARERRYTPIAPNLVEWSVTFDDPATWARPWTFAMNLTKTTEPPFEYACHEGNYAMRNILSIAREEEKAAGR